MNGHIQYGLFRAMTSPVTPGPANLDLADDIALDHHVCQFSTPIRFGRRRTDQFGHLELTRDWLRFRSVLDVSVAWSEVERVNRRGREVEIALADSTRLLRFWCPCLNDPARAAVLAEHFAGVARGRSITADTASHACV